MVPAASYQDICEYIARMNFGQSAQKVSSGLGRPVKMIGLLFARPSLPLTQAEVVPNLDYFHYRSGPHIDFFCAGYDGYTGRDEADGFQPVVRENGIRWGLSQA